MADFTIHPLKSTGQPELINEMILASGSSFRRKLLASTGLSFRVETSLVDEEVITAPDPGRLALARAEAKATEVAQRFAGALVIGADQVLGMEGKPFGKAANVEEARLRLQSFAGRTHLLHSAYVLAFSALGRPEVKILRQRLVDVPMHMRQLSSEDIDAYLATGEWQGCAGCYQAENRGAHLLLPPMGESTAIIGLPLPELLRDLRSLGVDGLRQARGPWAFSPA